MVAIVVLNPGLVSGNLTVAKQLDEDATMDQLRNAREALQNIPMPGSEAASAPAGGESNDPMKGLLDALKEDQQKK
jgi:hypothetical protein